jgi:glycosyltransferase involved in cell wall biosynthesis
MRLLWFSHFIPYPPRGGAHQRSYNLLRHVARRHETSLVAFNLKGHSPGELSDWQAELAKHCSRVMFWQMPVKWKSIRWGAKLICSPLKPEPYSCHCFWSPETEMKWQATLQEHQGALVHFDSIDLALFAAAAAGYHKVLNHHNCESAMADRRAELETNPLKKLYLQSQARKLARLEQSTCPLFDINLAVSEADAKLLRKRSPDARFCLVENSTDTEYFSPSPVPPEPDSLAFVSSLNWYPNISAIQYFVREIWPLVKARRPGVGLYVVGMKPSRSLSEWLRQDSQIELVDSPPDVRPWMAKAAVLICPMNDGGGTKVKILDGMAMGKAIVSTSLGCEGLEVRHGAHILIADAQEDFAARTLEALQDRALRDRLGAEARSLVQRKYNWSVVGTHLEEAYRAVVSDGKAVVRKAVVSA